MAKGKEKTNVMRILDHAGIRYTEHCYAGTDALSGTEVAAVLGQDPDRVFKTLVTRGASGQHYVFMIPVAEELDLKKAARCIGEKSVAMIKSKELLPLTGYLHGGCSPIGMKKQFPTAIHRTAADFATVFFSAGKIGYQVEMNVQALKSLIPVTEEDLIVKEA